MAGQHDNRYARRFRSYPAENFLPTDARHSQIGDDKVYHLRQRFMQSVCPVFRSQYLITFVLECHLEPFADILFVVDN